MGDDPATETRTLQRDGSELWYEVSGKGPTLLVLASGFDDSASSAPMAMHLQDDFTVLRYDRRGVSRSPEQPNPEPSRRIATHADDAAALATAEADGPVYVVGASIGSLVGLELVARYPDLVRGALLHEPPLEYLVPNPERTAKLDEAGQLAANDPVAALPFFGKIVGGGDVREPDAPAPPRPSNPKQTIANFFATDFLAVRQYVVNDDAVASLAARITLSNGAHSAGRFEALCSEALASKLGIEHRTLATGHSAIGDFPRTTAEALRSLWVS